MKVHDSELRHESAAAHVTGKAMYVADMESTGNVLAGRVVFSPHARARIVSYDLSAARKIAGVYAVLDYHAIPGHNQLNALANDEPCLAKETVNCIGQAMFLIAADSDETAILAEKSIEVEYEILEPVLDIQQAKKLNQKLAPARTIQCGSPDQELENSPYRLNGSLTIGGQEHWYLETQSALCVPGEQPFMTVYASSQNPTETQLVVAEVLGLDAGEVVCEVKRMGGGFGGKETQANHIAAWAALLAYACAKPVKMVLFRDDDQKYTGKRHRFEAEYEIGFDETGKILAYRVNLDGDAGMATDLSMAILERALFHADSSYFVPHFSVKGTMWKTNLPSNTAFRGFGGPQGMLVIEHALDEVAAFLGMDAAELRFRNFYGLEERNVTPYQQTVDHNRLFMLYERLVESSSYFERKKSIAAFNARNLHVKRGIAMNPVKFGISFTTSFLNQAGALVNIYKDGTLLVNHGGTEMGQGLHTKIRQIAASELGLPLHKVHLSATNTSKVPNTSPTAASSGTDLNGMAVLDAVQTLKKRLFPVAKSLLDCPDCSFEQIAFMDGKVFEIGRPERTVSFQQLVDKAHKSQISLSATGFYGTPGLWFDRLAGKGNPFHYFAFGMAVSEVEIDVYTGMYRILRTDILHDAGKSINEAVDLGQVAGGFVQGAGWCTTEVLRYNDKGQLLNHSPDTYKIPSMGDMPAEFNVHLLSDAPNPMAVRQSKAVGEPPFMLAFSVWLALKDAIRAANPSADLKNFRLPATNEVVLLAVKGFMQD